MNPSDKPEPNQRERELIAGDVLGDLSEDERLLFDELGLERHSESRDELARTAAALHLGFESSNVEPMPDRLRGMILADAPSHLRSAESSDTAEGRTADDQPRVTLTAPNQPPRHIGRREMVAWFAFAATLLAAIVIWNQGTTELTWDEARAELILNAEDLTQVSWSEGKTPFEESVSGDVVWSTSAQTGFMRFVGMPVNDPTTEQYQLWIIDPQRDERPIDGGVFNVSSQLETIIPINAKLSVIEPAAFAVTIEKPGGVVVSNQDRLPLIAAVN